MENHQSRIMDAVGVALFSTHLANKKTVSALRASYPEYYMSKTRLS
jgi:phosphomannomutase